MRKMLKMEIVMVVAGRGFTVRFAYIHSAKRCKRRLRAARTAALMEALSAWWPTIYRLIEIGYLPIDQRGADLLFQVISQRYERGSIVLTSNKAFKQWATIFNGDSTIASAVLDRLLHHAETVLIEGASYRMKDRIES
jgi:hypothetical protein